MFDSGTALRKILSQSDRFDFKNILKVFKVFEVLWESKCDFYYFISLSIFFCPSTQTLTILEIKTLKKEKKSWYMQFLLLALSRFFNLL